jgi:ABC-type Fe3+ transport system substrate-binding protein
MVPALALFAVIALPANAPHPNAGKLMMDFLLSQEGQEIYAKFGYITVDPDVPPQDASLRPDGSHYRALNFTPDQVSDVLPKFARIYQDIFK